MRIPHRGHRVFISLRLFSRLGDDGAGSPVEGSPRSPEELSRPRAAGFCGLPLDQTSPCENLQVTKSSRLFLAKMTVFPLWSDNQSMTNLGRGAPFFGSQLQTACIRGAPQRVERSVISLSHRKLEEGSEFLTAEVKLPVA